MTDKFSHIKWEYISRLWNNKISEQEEDVFPNEQIKSSLKDYYTIRRASSSALFSEDIDVERAWESLNHQISKGSVISLWKNVLRYTAVVLSLFICATLLWYYFPTKEIVLENQKVSIIPGEKRAQLILASGEEIILGKEYKSFEINQPGARVYGDSISGKLKYSKIDISASSEIQYNTLKVPKGGEFYLELADGSKVWLNSETVIKYPVSFGGNTRDVYIQGEAYFNVAHDKSKPFFVHSGNVNVKVLGTRFNVSAYPEEDILQTTLVSGSVKVNKGNSDVILKPSYQYSFNKLTGESEVRKVDTDLYTSWVDGKFYFKGFTFEDVVRKLERWYDFEMFYLNEEVKHMKFRGVINKHEPLEMMLRKLEKTADICFRIKGKTIIVEKIHK